MDINSFFDKIYCINLKHREDKWKDVENIFKRHKIDVERFEGFNGWDSNYKPGNPPIGWSPINLGNIGCLISHATLLEQAANNGLNNILIFEDDVDFIDNFVDLSSKYLESIPTDWHMIYFGGNYQFGDIYYNPSLINKFVSKTKLILGTHAVGINKSLFYILADRLWDFEMPVDLYYSSYMQNYNCYTSNQNLAFQRPTFSDIEQKEVDYRYLYK